MTIDARLGVTAIVPAYERPHYVKIAIESALAQTYPHVEVLVGDDSRSDAVERVVADIGDSRVRYHRNEPALGAMGNWIDLLARARTDFVASLNDDDFWSPQFLARTVPPMIEDATIGLSFCDSFYVDEHGVVLDELSDYWSRASHRDALPEGRIENTDEDLLRMIAVWNSPQPAYAAVMRRALVAAIHFPATTDPCHDLWCTYRLWTGGSAFHYVNERLTNYRVHGGNLTNAGFAIAEDFIFGVIASENPSNPATAELRRRWAGIRFSRAMRVGPGDESAAVAEMRAATADLDGWRRATALATARAPVLLRAAWLARRMAHRVGR